MNYNSKLLKHMPILKLSWLLLSLVIVFQPVNAQLDNALKVEKGISISNTLKVVDLFKFITRTADYQFFYNNSLNELDEKITLNVTNMPVDKVLDKVFEKIPLEYKIDGKNIYIRKKNGDTSSSTTDKTIFGIVKDESNSPLPGVNILVKNTKKGTATDVNGRFSMEIDLNDVLIFKYLGYKDQTITISNKNNLQIYLEPDINQLNEIIVAGVAAGTSKKKMSVSVAKLNAEDFTEVSQSSIASSLQGKIAGVNVVNFNGSPGGSPVINLRGFTNINGQTGALVLVDGVIMQGSLADLNADDIASVEVVKGAAASSLYGSRAGNGVIVVTSKRGKELENGKTSVVLRSEFGTQDVAKYIDLADAHPYTLATDYMDVNSYTKYSNITYPADYVSGWNPAITGTRTIKADAYMDQPFRINNDLQKSMFTKGNSSTYYLGLGHKSQKSNLFVSYENNTDQGIVVETGGYKRHSFRVNIDQQITDKLKLSVSNNYIKTSNNFMGGGTGAFFDVLMMDPDVDLFQKNIDGQNYNYYPNHWNTQINNPLYDLWRKDSNSAKDRFMGNYEAKWIVTDWANIEGSYAFETQNYKSSDYTPFKTFNGIDATTNTLTTSDGSLHKYTSNINNQNYRLTLNLSKKWNELETRMKFSYLYEDNKFESFGTTGSKFTLADLPSLNYFANTSFVSSDNVEIVKSINYFVIGSAVYKDRYILDGLFRYDGSSLFGVNERWHGYYRISGAYRLTEDFKIPAVEELKLRVATGTSGQRPGYSYQYETFSASNGTYSKQNLGNNYLKPSNSQETEIGIDASFLKMFTLEATYSKTITNDQFLLSPLASQTGGFKYQWINGGTVESNSFEAMLKAKIIDTKEIKFNVSLTFDKSVSRITKLDIPSYSTGPRNAFKIKEGEEYGVIYGVDFVRTLEQMKAQLLSTDDISNYSVNRDGVVVKTADIGTLNEKPIYLADTLGVKINGKIGNTNPLFNMGISTSFTYKNLTFYTLWKWKNGGDLYNGTAQYLVRDLRHSMMDQTNIAQSEKKTVNYYQGLYDAQALNGFWVEDASFVRLSEIALKYQLKGTVFNKTNPFFNTINVGLTAKNLLTVTKYTGYDPEAGYDGFLFDNYGYPNFRNYSLSIELKF